MENTETRGNIPGLDVRESWQTTLAMVEMRLAGSANMLRRIERFELDNGYFGPTPATSPMRKPAQCTGGPFGLMLYIFQISQPGGDYKS